MQKKTHKMVTYDNRNKPVCRYTMWGNSVHLVSDGYYFSVLNFNQKPRQIKVQLI